MHITRAHVHARAGRWHNHEAPPEAKGPVAALEQGLRRLMWLEQKRMRQVLSEHDLTVPQFIVLVSLAHDDHGCSIGSLASKLSQSNATMTGIIDRLEQERLVLRTRDDATDRRKVKVDVTAKGRALLERANQTWHEEMSRALAGFPPAEIELFVNFLNKYVSELEKEP